MDGFSPDSTVVNWADPSSCWTKPLDPPILSQYPIANGGTCRVCVSLNATFDDEPDNDPTYEIRVRDDKNHAIGGMDPFTMAPSPGPPHNTSKPSSAVSFPVGARSLNVWSFLPDHRKVFVMVYMVWDKPAGWDGPETMRYDTMSWPSKADNNCSFTDSSIFDGKTYFECQFHC